MLKNMKKVVSIMLMSALLLTMVQITAFGAYTAPTTPEKQFVEDFEAYQVDTVTYFTDENGNSFIYNGLPSSGD